MAPMFVVIRINVKTHASQPSLLHFLGIYCSHLASEVTRHASGTQDIGRLNTHTNKIK